MVSRESDGRKFRIIAGMLGDMLLGAVVPLVYCDYISVAPLYSLVCFSWLDDEEGISIIHFWIPMAFNNNILVFTYYDFVLVRGNYTFIVTLFFNKHETELEVGEDFCIFCLA